MPALGFHEIGSQGANTSVPIRTKNMGFVGNDQPGAMLETLQNPLRILGSGGRVITAADDQDRHRRFYRIPKPDTQGRSRPVGADFDLLDDAGVAGNRAFRPRRDRSRSTNATSSAQLSDSQRPSAVVS